MYYTIADQQGGWYEVPVHVIAKMYAHAMVDQDQSLHRALKPERYRQIFFEGIRDPDRLAQLATLALKWEDIAQHFVKRARANQDYLEMKWVKGLVYIRDGS